MSPDLRDPKERVESGLRAPAEARLIHSLSSLEGLGVTWELKTGDSR